MRLPDFFGQVGELLQVLGAVLHLLPPPRGVDGQDRLEVVRGYGDPVEVKLVLGRDDADGGLDAVDFTLGQALSAFQLVRSGNDNDPASFNGGSVTLTGSGQTISTLESAGTHGNAVSDSHTAPGAMVVVSVEVRAPPVIVTVADDVP